MQFASSPGFEPFRRRICERESLNGLDGNGLQSFRLSQWNEIFFERNLSRILFICVFVCFKGRIELPLTDKLNPYLQNVRGVVAASMASMAMASNPSGSHNGIKYFLKGSCQVYINREVLLGSDRPNIRFGRTVWLNFYCAGP